MKSTYFGFSDMIRGRAFAVSFIVGAACLCAFAAESRADSPPTNLSADLMSELRTLRDSVGQLTSLVKAQQKRIEALEKEQREPVSASSRLGESINSSLTNTTAAPIAPPVSRPSGTYLPDIGVVADIVGTSSRSKEDEEGNDRLSVREVEVVFGHDIDPFSRMDAVITFSDQEDPDIEEANVTYWGLPLDMKGRIGRYRPRIGKASSSHRDTLETVDEPLVVQRYLGKEGLFRTGVELSAFAPWSLDYLTQEGVIGFMEGGVGEEGELFDESTRIPSYYAHLSNFLSISDSASFELGATFLMGSQDEDSRSEVRAFGIDGTFSFHPTPLQKIKLQSELYVQDRSELAVSGTSGAETYQQNPYGLYALTDYRFAERWSAGFRYDYVEPTQVADYIRDAEQGWTGYLTFFQSEFARWRIQYQRANLLDGTDDNRFFLQGTFAIGAHKHALN